MVYDGENTSDPHLNGLINDVTLQTSSIEKLTSSSQRASNEPSSSISVLAANRSSGAVLKDNFERNGKNARVPENMIPVVT